MSTVPLSALPGASLLPPDDASPRYWSSSATSLSPAYGAESPDGTALVSVMLRLDALVPAVKEVLRLLACIGRPADSALLAALSSKAARVARALDDALLAGLVSVADGRYALAQCDLGRQICRELSPEQLCTLHLRIGRQLLADAGPAITGPTVIEIVDQLNLGQASMPMRAEREQCAQLNLQAGAWHRGCASPVTALRYFEAGLAMLGGDAGDGAGRGSALAFTLLLQSAECHLQRRNYGAAQAAVDQLSRRAASIDDSAAVARLKVALHAAMDRTDQALTAALGQVAAAGISLAPQRTLAEAHADIDLLWQRIARLGVPGVATLPRMPQPAMRARMDALGAVLELASDLRDPRMLLAIIGRIVCASLDHGNTDASALAYVLLAAHADARHPPTSASASASASAAPAPAWKRQLALPLAQTGLELAATRATGRFKAAANLYFGQLIAPFHQPLPQARMTLHVALATALERGQAIPAAQARHALMANLMASGVPLAQVQAEADSAAALARDQACGAVADILAVRLRLLRSLRGTSAAFGRLNDAGFDERLFERHLAGAPALALAARCYWIQKLQLRCHAGAYAEALQAAQACAPLMDLFPADLASVEHAFFSGLAHAALHDAEPADDADAVADNPGAVADNADAVADSAPLHLHPHPHLAGLADAQRRLAQWRGGVDDYGTDGCGTAGHDVDAGLVNFGAHTALLDAELARLRGHNDAAARAYALSCTLALEHGLPHIEALCCEAAARFCQRQARPELAGVAQTWWRRAHQAYVRWGATGKRHQLESAHAGLRQSLAPDFPMPG